MDQLLFGAAYYDEYMPTDRIDTDVEMMKAAGITVVRIAESTWSSLEPQPGVFDFTHVDRALDAFEAAGIHVIVGTPTYAVPAWLVQSYPEVLAVTNRGEGRYGARQIMNIANPTYRFHAERVIRAILGRYADHPAVIGFQVDNEPGLMIFHNHGVFQRFVDDLRQRYNLDNMTVGLLGMAFKAEIDDIRASLSYKFKKVLNGYAREVLTTDPFVTVDPDLLPFDDVVERSDLLILCTPHAVYRTADLQGKPVIDVWNMLQPAADFAECTTAPLAYADRLDR